jgi:acyl-CoA thioesterase II
VGDLAQDTAVEGRAGSYRAVLSKDWEIWGPMGGYVAAVALRAMAGDVPDGFEPASFTCQFLSVARFGAVDIAVTVRRGSRRAMAVDAHITQADAAILDAQAWFTVPGDVVTHDHTTPHRYGHPDDHRSVAEYSTEAPPFPFWLNFDGKPLDWVEDWAAYPGGEPEWAEWLKFEPTARWADPVLEAARLVLLADLPSYPAAVRAYPGGERTFVAPSLDLSVQLHRLGDLSDWLLLHGTAAIADRGLIGFRSEVWSADGRQVASGSGQLLSRAVPPPSG